MATTTGTTIKLDSRVNATSSASSGTLYTVPANCYLVVTGASFSAVLSLNLSSSVSLAFDGFTIASASSSTGGATITAAVTPITMNAMIGPGGTVSFSSSGSLGSYSAVLRGVLFTNSP